MNILVVDNYDSFTWNLVHYLEEICNCEVSVLRNDVVSTEDALRADGILLSPGPGLPAESGKLMQILQAAAGKIPILGVCLGLQAITEHYGGKLTQLDNVLHGMQRKCIVTKKDALFDDIPQEFLAGRYHSWVADPKFFPSSLEILAVDEQDNIMALRHSTEPVYGVQFHPESIMTPFGKKILQNWLSKGLKVQGFEGSRV